MSLTVCDGVTMVRRFDISDAALRINQRVRSGGAGGGVVGS